MEYQVKPVGTLRVRGGDCRIELLPEYATALVGLEGFGAVQVLWWFSGCDNKTSRAVRTIHKPYRKGPDTLGVFATRSPERPNPIALSCATVTYIDSANGVIGLAYCDAFDGTPVLDVKPYTPSLDRVEHPTVPAWCAHWPKNTETSGDFDWSDEFNF